MKTHTARTREVLCLCLNDTQTNTDRVGCKKRTVIEMRKARSVAVDGSAESTHGERVVDMNLSWAGELLLKTVALLRPTW